MAGPTLLAPLLREIRFDKLVSGLDAHVHKPDDQVQEIMGIVSEPRHESGILFAAKLSDLFVEQVDDFVTIGLESVECITKVRGVDAAILLEALLHLLRSDHPSRHFFVKQGCGLLDDLRACLADLLYPPWARDRLCCPRLLRSDFCLRHQ